jgi:hypothetical protein
MWPVRTEVGVGMLLCPPVENLGERGGLSTTCGQFLLQHEQQHEIAFGGEVEFLQAGPEAYQAAQGVLLLNKELGRF